VELWETFGFPLRFSLMNREDYSWLFGIGNAKPVVVIDLIADLVRETTYLCTKSSVCFYLSTPCVAAGNTLFLVDPY
jgi:hypothetical protein